MNINDKFSNLCKYYLECLNEDDSGNNSVFANGRSVDYVELGQPELTHRENTALTANEESDLRNLHIRLTRGNQKKTWWYGFPTLFRWAQSQSGWQGGFLEPVFIVPLDVETDSMNVEINTSAVRLNTDALKNIGVELEEAQQLAIDIGIYSQAGTELSLFQVCQAFKERYPQLHWACIQGEKRFSEFGQADIGVHEKGIVYAKEGSPYTQGLEFELRKLIEANSNVIQKSSIWHFLSSPNPILRSQKKPPIEIVEAVPLNETQKQAVIGSLENPLTVITGPPGTGKSQVVASIILNAALLGKRVLFASKNHKAVDVVEDRVNRLANRPFLIRLGKRGSQERNIQQELIQYLNSLLGVTSNPAIADSLNSSLQRLNSMKKRENAIESSIEVFRLRRIDTETAEREWQRSFGKMDAHRGREILNWATDRASKANWSLWSMFSENRKHAFQYAKCLERLKGHKDLEKLSEELFELKGNSLEEARKYFKLWVDDTPGRLNKAHRSTIADFTSVLQQMIGLDNTTPRQVWARLYKRKDDLMSMLAGFLPAWCVVNLSARGQLPLAEGFFDIVVIDEASQCDIPSALPLLFRAKQAVIIGDPNQLQHITSMRIGRSVEMMGQHGLEEVGLASFEYTCNSLYKLAASKVKEDGIVMLNEHFRSHADIINFSNEHWYHGALSIGTDYRDLNPPCTDDKPSVQWFDTTGEIEQTDGSGATIRNEVEAVVTKAVEIIRQNGFQGEIGIVTPFRLQANKIRERLVSILTDDEFVRTNLIAETAVRFQGDERDIMIFSPVVSTKMPKGVKYYLSNTPNLFNVAITRARASLIVVGNQSACRNCGISHIERFGEYVAGLKARVPMREQKDLRFETSSEKILYLALREKGIIAIPQYVVGQYRLDLAILSNQLKIDVEVDGKSTHTDYSGQRVKRDIIRNLHLQRQGWKVVRFWVYEIRDNLDGCLKRIQTVLSQN